MGKRTGFRNCVERTLSPAHNTQARARIHARMHTQTRSHIRWSMNDGKQEFEAGTHKKLGPLDDDYDGYDDGDSLNW